MGEGSILKKVVDEKGLESATMEGWEIDDIREADRVEDVLDQIPVVVPGIHPGSYPSVQTASCMRKKVVRSLRFIMWKNADSELAKRSAEVAQLNEDLKLERDRTKNAGEDLAKQGKEIERLETDRNVWKMDCEKSRRDVESIQKSIRQYEADMAKIRSEVGEATMRRILGR